MGFDLGSVEIGSIRAAEVLFDAATDAGNFFIETNLGRTRGLMWGSLMRQVIFLSLIVLGDFNFDGLQIPCL